MNHANLSVFIFVDDRDALLSCTQAVPFSLVSNTHREIFLVFQPRHVLHSLSKPYPDSLCNESGLSLLSGYEGCSGLNIVCITNNTAFLARSTQLGSSVVIVMISLMNIFIGDYFALVSTVSVYA